MNDIDFIWITLLYLIINRLKYFMFFLFIFFLVFHAFLPWVFFPNILLLNICKWTIPCLQIIRYWSELLSMKSKLLKHFFLLKCFNVWKVLIKFDVIFIQFKHQFTSIFRCQMSDFNLLNIRMNSKFILIKRKYFFQFLFRNQNYLQVIRWSQHLLKNVLKSFRIFL